MAEINGVEFTPDEVNVLFDALNEWKRRGSMGGMLGDLMTAMIVKDDAERAKIEAKREQERLEREQKTRADEERAVVIQAKLVMVRDKAAVTRILK